MKIVSPEGGWPESWKEAFAYDLEEVYGPISNHGYAYAYANRKSETLRLVAAVLAPGSRVLDIAAAQGNITLALAEMGYAVTWNDLRAELADYVRLKQSSGKVAFFPGNAFELEFPAPFDAVVATEIIEHVAHPDEFLVKTAALVRPGGWIIMTTPNGAYFRNTLPKFSECPDPSVFESIQFKPNSDGHIFLLHPEELRSLAARAGLELEELVLTTNPLTAGHVKTHLFLASLPRAMVDALESATRRLPERLTRKLSICIAARFHKPVHSGGGS